MTEPMRVGELLPGVLGEVVDRAGHGYDRWAELVAQAGYCHHPIRLAGRVEQADRQSGEVRTVYDSDREPDGVLLKACGTRRESRCPSCAATYRADAYQLLAAGLKGGKGVPESVAGHPRLFVTFTAPSFGRVHTRKAQGRVVLPCHPHRQGARCPHGNRAGCWHRHDEDDPRLGEPLCPGYYAEAQVLWNALAPELWRRTTIALQRALGRLVGLQEGELRRLVRVSYAKVAEFQRRGAVHFHAVIRLDRRLTDADDLERLDKLPANVGELVRAAWALGGRPELEGLRLRAWAHMLGFRGHWSTKSRRYSTTFAVLRRARVAFAKRRRARDGVPLDAWGRPEDDQGVIVVASWVYVGSGYETEGERWLALSAAARAREQRRIAYVKLGRHVRIAAEDLEAFIVAGRVEGGAARKAVS